MKNVFIIGSKGIPARYGGFETFVGKLTAFKKDSGIKYHVACLANDEREFVHNDARCFNVKIKDIGSAKAITYDLFALRRCIHYIEENKLEKCVIYVLACRIGPFIGWYKRKLEKLNIKLYVNPDGNEWRRSKWNRFIRTYWKFSEKLMIKHADLLICDAKAIERYIHEEYGRYKPNTTFISYGADIRKSELPDDSEKLLSWYREKNVTKGNYYLIVGRFVPENNYETVIREFMSSNSEKDLVLITNVAQNTFYEKLRDTTGFDKDHRIKFVGTVYDEELLKKIRENAFAYFHGHEVGGTNPSLLEALASTELNILLDVSFNKEVGEDGALYFTKEKGSLKSIIRQVENMELEEIQELGNRAKQRIIDHYSWDMIVKMYEELIQKTLTIKVEPSEKEGLIKPKKSVDA